MKHLDANAVARELYRCHSERLATLILIDTCAGWKGSLPASEVAARAAAAHEMPRHRVRSGTHTSWTVRRRPDGGIAPAADATTATSEA
jgi:hypothetical protein